MNRREFLASASAAAALPFFGGCLSPRRAGGTKVRLACIGIGNQGWNDIRKFDATGLCEIVALCDTDLEGRQCAPALARFPKARRFDDFRKLFDAMRGGIDAVAVMTPDHSHFPALMAAMREGYAVYSEKPLAHSFREHELLLAAARKYGVVTQMGNQGHSEESMYQFREYVERGIFDPSKLVSLVAHMNAPRRWHKWGGKVSSLPRGCQPPASLNWDAWLASAPYHEYSPDYVQGDWRSWYDFGNGCLGDWGAHTMDTMHRFFDLGLPTAVGIRDVTGWNPFVFPIQDTLVFSFPAKGRRPAVDLTWHEGVENLPELPEGYSKPLFKTGGQKLKPGKIIRFSDGTAWQGSSHGSTMWRCGDGYAPAFPKPTSNHYENFLLAVIGEERANSPFEIAVPLCEVFALGCIAQRLNRGFRFDPATRRPVDDPEVETLMEGAPVRSAWEEFYRV